MGVQETVEDSADQATHHPLDLLSEPTEVFFGETPRFTQMRSRYRLLVLRINLVSWIDHHRRLLELFRQIQEDLVRRSQRFLVQRQSMESRENQNQQAENLPASGQQSTPAVEKESFVVAENQAPIKILKSQNCKKEIMYRDSFCRIKAKESIKLGKKSFHTRSRKNFRFSY